LVRDQRVPGRWVYPGPGCTRALVSGFECTRDPDTLGTRVHYVLHAGQICQGAVTSRSFNGLLAPNMDGARGADLKVSNLEEPIKMFGSEMFLEVNFVRGLSGSFHGRCNGFDSICGAP
jgi:hypothetical protein